MLTRSLIAACLLLDTAGALAVSAEAEVRQDERQPYWEVDSALPVGNKGEELLDVSVPERCGVRLWAFDHAELHIDRNRYGGAQFVNLPRPGCLQCDPLVVRWYHEPTGHLSFEVRVYRRAVLLPCDAGQLPVPANGEQPG